MQKPSSFLVAVVFAALLIPASARADTVCATSGQHTWIIPNAVFSSNVYGTTRGTYGAALAALFAPYGVSIAADPADTLSLVDERNVYGGGAVDTSLIWNLLGGRPTDAPEMRDLLLQSAGNRPANFTLIFAQPVSGIRFVRAGLIAGGTGITHPEWTATARDAAGNVVATQHENLIASYSAVPARIFDLGGSARISSITFAGDNHAFAAFTNLVLQLIAWCH
ncbi:MAG TPA: hypothetical protein VMD47_00895 [Candidatus Acidoferrales bacterium]|nr:hypothetical protein [Candidatus Acidoferrales bacterium]